jgi:hypothetical protein
MTRDWASQGTTGAPRIRRLERGRPRSARFVVTVLLAAALALTACFPLEGSRRAAAPSPGHVDRMGSYGFYGDPYGHPNDTPHRIRRAVIEGRKLGR